MRKSFFIFSVFVILCSVFVYADDSNTASNNAVVAQTPVSTGAATSAANTISDKITAASTNAVSAAVKGFRYAKWICYDGKSSSEGGDSSPIQFGILGKWNAVCFRCPNDVGHCLGSERSW